VVDENILEKFQKAEFNGDFIAEFEFISPSRLRLCDKSTDRDYFWDLEDLPRNMPIPTHVIPPVDWPARNFSPDMPQLKTKGRQREFYPDDENKKTKLIIDKTDALAGIRGYVKTLRDASWWVEGPAKNSTSLNLEARKGMWQLNIKNGNGSNTYEDTVVIESTLYPVGKWPQAWTKAKLEPPLKSIIIGSVDNKIDESDRSISEKLYFDRVNNRGVEEYAAQLQKAGFMIPQNAGENWKYYKYIRVNGDLYRVEVTREGRYGEITAFQYDFKYFPDGEWPTVWHSGGLPAPEGSETITGAINMSNWDDKDKWYGSFSASIRFLSLPAQKIDAYFEKHETVGFLRMKQEYSDRVTFISYIRLGDDIYRVEIEKQKNEEIAEINYTYNYFVEGVWPADWKSIGIPAPQYKVIVGAFDL
jgi:hypothetical protein